MKKFAINFLPLAVAFLIGLFFYSNSSRSIAESEVLDVMNQIHQAEKDKDEEKLNQMLADKMSSSRYKVQDFFTKEQFMENLKGFPINSIHTESAFTEIEDDKAKVYFTMKIKFIYENGKIITHNGNYTYSFEKQNREWKLASIHLEN